MKVSKALKPGRGDCTRPSFYLVVSIVMTTEDLQGRALHASTKSNDTIHSHTPDDLDDLGDLGDFDELDRELKHADYDKDAEEVADPQHSDAETTIVQFTHARIEENGIGVDASEAQIHISITYLLILSDDIPKVGGNAWQSPDPADYAAKNFLYHLWAIDRSKTRKTDSQQIALLICSLFTNTESLMRWVYKASDGIALLDNSIANKDFLAMMQVRLLMLDDISQYSTGIQTWINGSRTSKAHSDETTGKVPVTVLAARSRNESMFLHYVSALVLLVTCCWIATRD